MSKTETPVAPAPEPVTLDTIRAAFEDRAKITGGDTIDRVALNEQDKLIQALVNKLEMQKPDAKMFEREPVMAQILERANTRNPWAVRLLCEPTTKRSLFQRGQGEKPLPDQVITIEGVRFVMPRTNKPISIPESVALQLEQCGIS